MKILVVGLGSMGKRRIRNLSHCGERDILGCDTSPERREEVERLYGIPTRPSFEAGMETDPDAVVISTPPNLHYGYAREVMQAGKHFFMEANVVAEGYMDLIRDCENANTVCAPSSTQLHHPANRIARQTIEAGEIGRPIWMEFHYGQNLADWHPWEDYRKFYASNRETGACRESVPFFLPWIQSMMGEPIDEVACMADKLSDLECDIDDLYQLIFRFENGTLGQMSVDVIQQAPSVTARVVGTQGVIRWEWKEPSVWICTGSKGEMANAYWRQVQYAHGFRGFNYEEIYEAEMEHWLAAVRGETTYCITCKDELRALRILSAAEESAATRKFVKVMS